ncbi:DUF7033 domain-containing protein [Pedobacter nyackensis]|uniref:DUF7033 domain-containing protein n=1 Tax=Pedobacter nyackensis TaxID=475255 RepID=UPI00292D9D75|nr:hypothetical protein [Pedobacter nyackensis]
MKLLIYVPFLSPRIKYIFNFIFNDILKTEIVFTVNAEEFKQSPLPKFSYAEQAIQNELFFKSSNLLFERKIIAQKINTVHFGEMRTPFPVTKSTLPFDIFAASFYFLSRYEEYVPTGNSKEVSYLYKNSLQYKLNLLNQPIIDAWALILKNILLKHFPTLKFGDKEFSFRPIYILPPSINPPSKNIISSTILYIKTLIDNKLSSKNIKITEIKQIVADMKRHGFIRSPAISIPDKHHQHHFSGEITLPKSYIRLTKNKTKNDYSIHYGNCPGFRAGTCTPFYWYDLQLEKTTQLLLHPVVTTDTALLSNKTTGALLFQINELISNVKLVNGDFYFLSLCNDIRPK